MFISRTNKALQNAQTRRQLAEQAIAECRALYRKGELEPAREPLLRLQDQYDQAGIDRLELLFMAEAALPGDSFWLSEIVQILLRKHQLTQREIPYLQRQVQLSPERLDLWSRLFKERRFQGDDTMYYTDREACALALLPYFPLEDETTWPDSLTGADAFTLLGRCLHDSVINIIDLGRMDERARKILKTALEFFPDRTDIVEHLARIYMRENDRSRDAVAMAMRAVLEGRDDIELKTWAATALLEIPGLFEQGLAIIRQVYQANPKNISVQEKYISALKSADEIQEEEDEEFLKRWVEQHHDDIRAIEMLADHFVAGSLLTEDALRIYKLAAAHSPKRRNYLRLMGKFYASRSEWSEVIAAFDEIRQGGSDTEEVIFPLAMAYSEFERCDAEAVDIYRRALELGTLLEGVHTLYCKHLYQTAPEAPESIAQFSLTLGDFPECLWAQLGVLRHYVSTGDSGRALDGAIALLLKHPMDKEAIRLGGTALAQDFSRKQLAKLAALSSLSLGALFEEAYRQAPDAGPIAMGLVRHRLANEMLNAETSRLLGDVCRRNPDALDLRVARADLLWHLGQEENAATIYRELLERCRAAGPQLPRGVTADIRKRILDRMANYLLRPAGPAPSDLDVLLEAAAEPEASTEVIIGVARTLVDLQLDHADKLSLIARAMRLAPGDGKLERAHAEGFAARGNPVPALELAIRLVEKGDSDDETTSLFRTLLAVTKSEQYDRHDLHRLEECLSSSGPAPAVLLAGMEVVFHGRPCHPDDLMLLEALAEIFPRNVKVKRWLARALAEAGEHGRSGEVLAELANEDQLTDDVVVDLARVHARLGQHMPENLRIAQAAARIEPQNTDLMLHLAAIELAMNSYQSAAKRLRAVLRLNPDCHPRIATMLESVRVASTDQPELLLLLAEVHIRGVRVEQALTILSRLQGNYQRHFADLIQLYTDLIGVAPDNPRPRMERGVLFRLSGQVEEALADLQAAHELAPDNQDIAAEYADVYSQVIQANPDSPVEDYVKVGRLYFGMDDPENSFHMVELALAKQRDCQDALLLLARLQLGAGALAKCRDTLESFPKSSEHLGILQELSRAYAEQGRHLEAAEVLTQAIEVAGPQRELLEQLRHLHRDQDRNSREVQSRQKIFSSLSNRAQGRYELREEIGSGSMGVVFKAYDRELDEIVVLKILPEHFANNTEALARFRHEAKAARKLAHPNIVRIHDFGEEGGRKHISMEYVAGGDLRTRLQKTGKLDPTEAVQIIREIGRALSHAHMEGVLHRDIKSANILLTSGGRVKLSDFGIAALLEGAARETDATGGGTGAMGTPLYMSPEQFDGASLTPASDLYSVGVLFYELLAGVPPFIRGSIAYHHQFTAPTRLPDITDGLWGTLSRLLEKKPGDRFQRAEDLLTELDQFQGRVQERQVDLSNQPTPYLR